MHTQEEHLISDLTSFSECHFWRHMISPLVADRNPARRYLPGFSTVELLILPFPIINNLKCSMGKHSKAMQITYSLSKLPHDLVSVRDFFCLNQSSLWHFYKTIAFWSQHSLTFISWHLLFCYKQELSWHLFIDLFLLWTRGFLCFSVVHVSLLDLIILALTLSQV